MTLKIIISFLLVTGFGFIYNSFHKSASGEETPIDKVWWNGLSDEWKRILIINQQFSKKGIDIFKLQHEYNNRLKAAGEDDYSELNKPLHDLMSDGKFLLGYEDMARRAKIGEVSENDMDLSALADLDTIYMVNGPGDLTPLRKFKNLRVLIVNECGIDNNISHSEWNLNLEPLRAFKKLNVLYCSSAALKSVEPLKDVPQLTELYCENSSVTSLSVLKNLVNLKVLSFGSKVKDTGFLTKLINLEELYISGCTPLPDLSSLKKIKKLSIVEGEMAVVDSRYQVRDIDFLRNLTSLEFLDLYMTSYRGNLEELNNMKNLKAVTLPGVNSNDVKTFKSIHKNCIVINSYQF